MRSDRIQKGLRVRIVVPTIALAQQWHHELLSYFGEDLQEAPGFYYGAMKSSTDLSCLIYVINTARDCLFTIIQVGKTVIFSTFSLSIYNFQTPSAASGSQLHRLKQKNLPS